MANKSLHKAKAAKNDEFYTQLSDIENELKHYYHHFNDKVIYCNCDTKDSNFVKFFQDNKERIGIKELIYSGGIGGLDFRSDEAIAILKEADIVVTNPPFSLFREYIQQLIDYDKKFLIVGNNNAITYKETFKFIKDNILWLGVNSNKTMEYQVPSGYKAQRVDDNGKSFVKVPAISWFTNLEHNKRNESIPLFKSYTPEEYPKYDNYNAIDVSKVNEIPFDYDGFMGVPITFLCKFNPSQFEIFGITNTGEINEGIRLPNTPHGRAVVDGKEIYRRILIKRN